MVKTQGKQSLLVDRHGKALALSTNTYSSNSRKLTNSRYVGQNRFLFGGGNTNPYKFLNPSERRLINQFALDLFHSSPIVHSAIQRKNEWVCATAWKPLYRGSDPEWGKLATNYLNSVAYPNVYVGGSAMTFNRLLLTISNQIDVLGDVLTAFAINPDGIAQIELYPSTMVGSRDYGKTTVTTGRYQSATIDDGVITNRRGKPIAYRLLSDKAEDDYDVSARDAQLIYEPSEISVRGISILAPGLLTALTTEEISAALTQMCHTEAKRQLIVSTESGNGDAFADSSNPMSDGIDDSNNSTVDVAFTPNTIDLGDVSFINAKSGEKIESLKSDRPHANAQEWIRYLTEAVVYDAQWALPLISPEKLNGANLKMIESQLQQTIAVRQQTLKRVTTAYTLFALAVAMENGDLPKLSSDDWRKWDWSMPPMFVINGTEAEDIAAWTAGTETLDSIVSRYGSTATEIRTQRVIESKDAIDKANELVAYSKGSLSFERALTIVGIGGNPQVTPLAEQTITTNPL